MTPQHPWRPSPIAYSRRHRASQALTEALSSVLGEMDLARDPLSAVKLQWSRLCGAALARFTEPVEIRGEALVVEVQGPHWREAMLDQRSTVMRRVRQVAPRLRWMRLVVIPPRVNPPPPKPPVKPDPRNADIDDLELRASLDALCDAARRQKERDE